MKAVDGVESRAFQGGSLLDGSSQEVVRGRGVLLITIIVQVEFKSLSLEAITRGVCVSRAERRSKDRALGQENI